MKKRTTKPEVLQYHCLGTDLDTNAMLFESCGATGKEHVCVVPIHSRQRPWNAELVRLKRKRDGRHYELEPVNVTDGARLEKIFVYPYSGGWKLTIPEERIRHHERRNT